MLLYGYQLAVRSAGYAFGVIVAILFVNLLSAYLVYDLPGGILGGITSEYCRGGRIYFRCAPYLPVFLAPFLTVYGVLFANSSVRQAESELCEEKASAVPATLPRSGRRILLRRFLQFVFTLCLSAPLFWSYTAHIETLWTAGRAFYLQTGVWTLTVSIAAFYGLVPIFFPRLAKIADDVETWIALRYF